MTTVTGAVGTVAASPSPSGDVVADDVQFQQETPTPDNDTADNSTNNTTSTATPTETGDFAGTNDSGDSGDSGDTVVVQVGDGDDSDSSSNESNSTAAGDDEPPFNTSKAEHEFNNGIFLNELSHNQTHAQFQIYNPTNDTEWVVTNNNAGQEPRIKSYELEPGESKTLTTPTTGNLLGWAVSVTSTESIQSIETGAQYNIQYTALVINWNPAGDMGPLIGIIGGIVIILMFVAVLKFNLRVGKVAIPLAGQSLRGIYQDEDLPSRDDPYSKQAKDLVHGFGLLGILGFNWFIGVLAFWDMYPIAFFWKLLANPPFVGQWFDPSTLVLLSEIYSNLMVYWAYNTVLFIAFVWVIGKWYLRRNGTYLHDIDPAIGDLDYAPWLLSPSREADLQVYKRLSESDSAPTQFVEISKKRLMEVNLNTDRKAYVVSHYDPKENIAYIVMEDVDPAKLARSGKQAEVAEYFRSMYTVLSDEVWHWAKKWGRQLKAIDSARIEGELMEGAQQKDEWMREDLSETNHEEIVTKEKTVEQDLKEQLGEVEGLTDSPSDNSQNSQTAGGSR
ncbi:hypothetical protein [Haloferax sp. Atlit-12N]|uniref:hypothetical protein n=1 Tax=Haloferax sp. Atlit-12N TaxID=2077203 RepID=UPI001314D57B|nr:hypothetical protein [Haloferax sp. Atlit-12N]